ncbi:Hypothetical predicted protein [Paramuricea clavata]|uniref:Uncharacterized protein n=1 Tax=Paramuricea clavata TaxID=317549 RepID=A0A6S7IL38_PARCT|nr:Hypothetical predicted protein [Paramuricea clavata]
MAYQPGGFGLSAKPVDTGKKRKITPKQTKTNEVNEQHQITFVMPTVEVIEFFGQVTCRKLSVKKIGNDNPNVVLLMKSMLTKISIQGGLHQWTSNSGIHTPKGSILFTSNTQESDRCVLLKASDFEAKSLMDALRNQFCVSAMHVFGGVKARDVKYLWASTHKNVNPCPINSGFGYITNNLGYQSIPT